MNSIMETVCQVCVEIRQKTAQGTSFQNLMKVTRKQFRIHNIDISIRAVRKKFLNEEEFFVNAYYDAEDDKNRDTPIEVIVFHNFDYNIVFDKNQITDFLIQIFDAVVHEARHQRQGRKRNYNSYWDHVDHETNFREYLADPDEVDAYSISIAIELCRELGKFRALRYLPKLSKIAKVKIHDCYVSPNLSAYMGQFQEPNNKVIKKLAKKIYIRLQKLDTDFIFM
jgi:hypothetical protein